MSYTYEDQLQPDRDKRKQGAWVQVKPHVDKSISGYAHMKVKNMS